MIIGALTEAELAGLRTEGYSADTFAGRLLATIAARDASLATEREWVRALTEDNGKLIAANDEACLEHCRVRDEEIARLRDANALMLGDYEMAVAHKARVAQLEAALIMAREFADWAYSSSVTGGSSLTVQAQRVFDACNQAIAGGDR